jgi:hypothetical protein
VSDLTRSVGIVQDGVGDDIGGEEDGVCKDASERV